MKYKEFARSPNYGKIYAYNQNGLAVDELDILELKLIYKEDEYKFRQILKMAVDARAENAAQNQIIEKLDDRLEAAIRVEKELINVIKKMETRIKALEEANKLI